MTWTPAAKSPNDSSVSHCLFPHRFYYLPKGLSNPTKHRLIPDIGLITTATQHLKEISQLINQGRASSPTALPHKARKPRNEFEEGTGRLRQAMLNSSPILEGHHPPASPHFTILFHWLFLFPTATHWFNPLAEQFSCFLYYLYFINLGSNQKLHCSMRKVRAAECGTVNGGCSQHINKWKTEGGTLQRFWLPPPREREYHSAIETPHQSL